MADAWEVDTEEPEGAAWEVESEAPLTRRGGTRAEARPFVAPTEDENARRQFARDDPRRVDRTLTAGEMLEQPNALDISGRLQAEREQLSQSPALIERNRQQALYDARASRPQQEAKPLELTNRMTTGLREATDNPAARGVVAGFAGLGKVGTGAVRLAADLAGAEGVAKFAAGAEGRANATEQGATVDLKGNDKLAADVFASITNSVPSMALGVVGGPALKTLFAQSALSEYGAGRDAGFDAAESATRAGIMGAAEAIGERFGFGEQVRLLKSVAKQLPTGELAKVFGSMLTKEIPGEQLTTAMQFMADKFGPAALNPNGTIDQYLDAAGETLKVTIAQTALMGGGPAAIGTVRNEYQRVDAQRASPVSQFLTPKPKQGQPIKPSEAKAAAVSRFDELAAGFGLPAQAQARAKQAVDEMMAAGRPASDVPEFLGKLAEAYNKRGMFAKPLDPQAIAELQTAIDGPAETDTGTEAVDNIESILKSAGLTDEAPSIPGLLDEEQAPAVDPTAPVEGEKINRNWSTFSPETGTLNIPRAQMPQIAAEHRGALVNFLNARGVSHEMATVDPAELKPTQAEFEPKKVAGMAESPSGRSLLVSADGHILDGHHQWIAAKERGEPVRVVRLDADIQDLLRLAHQFPSSTTAKGPTRKAADDLAVVPDPAVGVPGTGAAGADPAGAGGGTVRPVAADADGTATVDSGATEAGGGSGVSAGRDGEPDAALISDQRTAAPVAESQAPAPSEPGDGGVAPTQAGSAPKPRVIGSYGRTPNSATEIELRPNADGTLTPHTGKYPMVDFESGDPIVIPAGATDAQAAEAIRKAGAVTAKDKFFGVAADEAKTPEDVAAEAIATARKRIDGLKQLLACLTS